jgi:hypothetical protein
MDVEERRHGITRGTIPEFFGGVEQGEQGNAYKTFSHNSQFSYK